MRDKPLCCADAEDDARSILYTVLLGLSLAAVVFVVLVVIATLLWLYWR